MADDNSIEQGEKLANFLSGRDSFTPIAGELAGDAAIRVIGDQDGALDKVRNFLATNPDGYKPIEGEDGVDVLIRIVTNQAYAIATLNADLADLRATLTATKGHATRAKGEVAVLREALSPMPRKVGRPVARFGKPGAPYSPELAAIAIAGEESVEIVFSDGKAEIVDLAPVTAFVQAWLPRNGRHMLREPVELEGGDAELEVAGAALLSAGEQIGWCEFPEPVRVPKYGRVRLENCITF